ncbi:DUF3558 family protein [Nocardia harenae]|uniref:DUF3558 family protein n=1 Tax=Nocardia harenae TaxID=358707 RepID=UPI0009FE8725|nr:DUF3558 family protein [Nocardia harenae]
MMMKQSHPRALCAPLAAVVVALFVSSCDAAEENRPGSVPQTTVQLSDFDPCDDHVRAVLADSGLTDAKRFEMQNMVGDRPGRGCSYRRQSDYQLEIATTAARLGYVGTIYPERYDAVRVGGRPGEMARAEVGIVGSAECRLMVELALGGLWFRLSDYRSSAPDPCVELTDIATEVVGLLPSGN